ncbi:TetR/AcrR family transcriptional regulator [Hymenobacter coccineus]|uniref:HTH tetR-type domain-containing protein n=1 Tax=Hymenobacter coccineus TaxID=1908235 RepID=A0A1G1TJ16_9BACT|nr:TetR/AcrR family transcriptional regulator [Hymenobacter coccineus]OGX90860.1 hypothetical protein BEN49_05910 [Hymenobacter coccineus]
MARSVEFNEEEAIQKAMEVFWAKGYHGASLRELTGAMGINSSSLYNTIGDKHALFIRCVQHYTAVRREELQKRLVSGRAPLEVLVSYIHDAVEMIIDQDNSCLAIKTVFEVAVNDPRVKSILKAGSDYDAYFVGELIRRSIAQGALRTDEEPAFLAEYFICIWKGWHESFILNNDPPKLKKMAHYFIASIAN